MKMYINKQSVILTLVVGLVVVTWVPNVWAQEVTTPPDDESAALEMHTADADSSDFDDPSAFVIGIHVGPIVPVFSDLDVFVLPRLELGYRLGVWDGRLEPFFSVAYTAPGASGTIDDPRLADSGAYSWEMTQKQLIFGLGLTLRFFAAAESWTPYVSLAPLLFLLETTARGDSSGNAFGENAQTGTQVGLYGALGAEVDLGPGAAFFELGVTWSDLDNPITGDTNTGALTPALGYRFMF